MVPRNIYKKKAKPPTADSAKAPPTPESPELQVNETLLGEEPEHKHC